MDIKEKILEDIKKTGFIVELNSVSKLLEKDWQTEHSTSYEDKDENKSREIDIIASKVDYIKEFDTRITFSLVIEVKKSERPWIIFTTFAKFTSLGWRVLNKCRNTDKWVKSEDLPSGGFFSTVLTVDCIAIDSPRRNSYRVGKAFHELAKDPSDKSKIYEALISSAKAAYYLRNRFPLQKPKEFNASEEVDIQIFLPIVILEGRLFEVYNALSGKIQIEEKDYIPVEMSYSSPNYSAGGWDTDFFPDVIKFEFLDTYLDMVDNWRLSMKDQVAEIMRSLNKLPAKRF